MATIQIQGNDDPRDLNKDGKVSVWELWVSTAMIAAYLVVGIGSFVVMIAALESGAHPILKGAAVVIGIPLIVAAYIGVQRQRMFEKAEKLAQAEREHQAKLAALELRRLQHEVGVFTGKVEQEEDSQWSQQQADYYFRLYLTRYYKDGKLARDEWVADGLPKYAWDRANDLAKKTGIRRGKKDELAPKTLAAAWGEYMDYLVRQRIWVNVDGEMVRN